MTIHDFEKIIDSKIIKRGYAYYQYNSITDMEQTEQGEFRAIVSGSTDYDVVIKLDQQQNIVSHYCDCPYDWGDHCKHVVAVLYNIQENKLYKQSIHLSAFHQMKEQLKELDKAALVDLVVQLCKNKHAIKLEVMEVLKEQKKG